MKGLTTVENTNKIVERDKNAGKGSSIGFISNDFDLHNRKL